MGVGRQCVHVIPIVGAKTTGEGERYSTVSGPEFDRQDLDFFSVHLRIVPQ